MQLKLSGSQWARHQRRWFGKWHLYLGIIAGAIVAFVGLTGSILVFQDEIDQALNPEYYNVAASSKRMTVDELVPVIKKNYPELKFNYIMTDAADNPNRAYRLFNFKTEDEIFVNPYTGQISGKRIHESSFIHIVTELHVSLLVPSAGRYIVGIATLCLLILTISGLRMWIPDKWKNIKSVLTVKFSSGWKKQNYDWHNILGFYSSPVVILLSLTGFCVTFQMLVIPLLFIFSGKSPQGVAQLLGAKSVYSAGATQIPLTELGRIVNKEMPGARIAGLALPADSTGNFRLDLLSKSNMASGKREMLVIDQYSGKVLLNSRTDFPNIGNAYLSWLLPLHYGSFGGLPTKILALLGGLMPLILFVTGFIIWWPRYRKQKRKEKGNYEVQPVRYRKKLAHEIATEGLTPWKYFVYTLKRGFVYALWMLLICAILGGLYGAFSGIVVEPAVFTITYSAMLIFLNFIVALLCVIFNFVILLPLKKNSRQVIRYFALSLAFCTVFITAYVVLMNTGMKIF